MLAFRISLLVIAIWTNVTAFIAIYHQGWNLFAVVATDLNSVTWNAQFDADLLSYIFLTGVWLAWRHKFTAPAIAFGFIGGLLGNAFLAPYLLYLSFKTKGNFRQMILGENS